MMTKALQDEYVVPLVAQSLSPPGQKSQKQTQKDMEFPGPRTNGEELNCTQDGTGSLVGVLSLPVPHESQPRSGNVLL